MCWREQRRAHNRCPRQWGEENLCLPFVAEWYAIPISAPRNTPDTFLMLLGLVNPSCTGLIGSGVVVHLPSFFEELEALETQGKRSTTTIMFILNYFSQVLTVKAAFLSPIVRILFLTSIRLSTD